MNSNVLKAGAGWVATVAFLGSGIFTVGSATGFLGLLHLKSLVFLGAGTLVASPTLGALYYQLIRLTVSLLDRFGSHRKIQRLLPVVALVLVSGFTAIAYQITGYAYRILVA